MLDSTTIPGAVPTPPTNAPLLVGVREAARLLGVSDRTIWSMTVSGEIPHVRVRRRVLYSPNELRRWIAENTHRGDQ